MKSNKPLSRKKDLVTQEADGEIMIYDLNTNKALCLNETSAIVWEMCDGNNSVSEISEGLGKKLKTSASEDLVWLAIDQLKKENLLVNSEELENKFEGMNRRTVIKKIGLGTVIALPIVAGLTAPTVAMAGSGNLPAGTALGPASSMGDDCGGAAADQTARQTRCNTVYGGAGSACASDTATFTPATCSFDAGTNTSTYQCRCA